MPKPAPLFLLLGCLILTGCSGNTTDPTALYNKKANELIVQIIQKSECDCVLEIPKESIIEIDERPHLDIRKEVVKQLQLANTTELDTLVNRSRKFELDSLALQKNGIKIITLESVMAVKRNNDGKLLQHCTKGILAIQKPIFDRTFKKAVIDFSWVFTCIRMPIRTFEFKNNEWTFIEN